MNILEKKKIVILGMITQHIVAGHIWAVMHYLVGLRRLGYDVYYVEAHGVSPRSFFKRDDEDGWGFAADFIAGIMTRFDLGDRWAYHDVEENRCYGLREEELKKLYSSATLIINMHGGTVPLAEHSASGRLIFIDTDPGELQVKLGRNDAVVTGRLSAHSAWFTYAENYGSHDCLLPVSSRFAFKPMRAPLLLDFWEPYRTGNGHRFTTIGSWKQMDHEIEFEGATYHWSKHHEFLKIFDLPSRTSQEFELALGKVKADDWVMIEEAGWHPRRALAFSNDLDAYRRFLTSSRGEFTVAKGQYVHLRTGWFSNRSNCYLAAGLPVITQETGFSNVLPTGQGLFAFSTMEEILGAVDTINGAYEQHCSSALELAREYFSYDVVLPRMLMEVGL
ncbi:MAG: hypothetical protein H0T48_08755 [Gemmatimonadaceae bacterium]|nr:hypothetical protein [Gemmatimonadaceae bacterium]